MSAAPHIPVLLDPVMEALALAEGEILVDGTFGAGGYTRAALGRGVGHVYAFDRDPDAIAEGRELERDSAGRLTLIQERFSRMDDELRERGAGAVDAVTMDVGVSSMQLDRANRGFSFQADGPLDMRMEQSGPTAADLVNECDEGELADIIFRFGEEPRSRRIARAIVAARPLTRTAELASVIRRAVGYRAGDKKDPATRAFQALRIHLNRELEELDEGLRAAERLLRPGGRLAVVSFHSLEDRAVKRFLRDRSGQAPGGSRHLPVISGGAMPTFSAVAKPVRPDERELTANPRARSATLRVARRTEAASWRDGR